MPSTNIATLPRAQRLMQAMQPAPVKHNTAKLAKAQSRQQFVEAVYSKMDEMGWSINRACEHIHHLACTPSSKLHGLAVDLGKSGKPVSKGQIERWVAAFHRNGIDGLLDNRTGRKHRESGWELRAVALYAKPQKPSIQLVVDTLIREGFENVGYDQVRRYLMSLPTDMTTHSAGRLGAKEVKLNHRRYHLRTTENLPAGFCYQLDGHTIDTYLAHEQSSGLFRYELTAVMDVATRYIPSWWMGEAENAANTLFALADAFVRHDHVPAALHIDNGSGFKGKMMNDPSVGYYRRFGLDVIFALPGNAKAKGQIERWFGTMERSFGKQWDTYCGKDMSPSVLRGIVQGVKRGAYKLPSLQQYMERLREWIDEYHNKPHRGLGGRTPAQAWAELERTPLHYRAAAIVLPRKLRTVTRELITLDGRTYRHPDLIQFDGKKMIVEYSIHSDATVRVLTEGEIWICDAPLANKRDYLPESRIEQGKMERQKQALKRLEVHADEVRRRSGITHNTVTDLLALEAEKTSGANTPLQSHPDHDDEEFHFDLTNWIPPSRD